MAPMSPILHTVRNLLFAATTAALVSSSALRADSADHAMSPKQAVAVLVPGANSHVTGTVRFSQTADGVHVQANIEGLAPGRHGFHIHEFGDLSKPDLTSAGGHFNPEHHHHADRSAADRHVGDLGNLEADENGRATVDFVDAQLQLAGPHSIIGRAVIVHGKADDLKSQPAGDAGPRVAGGVIGIANASAR